MVEMNEVERKLVHDYLHELSIVTPILQDTKIAQQNNTYIYNQHPIYCR